MTGAARDLPKFVLAEAANPQVPGRGMGVRLPPRDDSLPAASMEGTTSSAATGAGSSRPPPEPASGSGRLEEEADDAAGAGGAAAVVFGPSPRPEGFESPEEADE